MYLRWIFLLVLAVGVLFNDQWAEAATSKAVARIGYFANITHAQALYGRSTGSIEKQLGGPVEWKVFNAGPSAMEALLAGAIDICYVGPNPAVNAYLRSNGKALRIIAGAANGGAALVVGAHVTARTAADLKKQRLAAPEFGNTQDVALKSWLKANGLQPGRDVQLLPAKNPDILSLLRQKQIAGAWLPEPWLTRALREVNARILVDERTLWPNGQFPTAVVVVRQKFLQQQPELVRRFLGAHLDATRALDANPRQAAQIINAELGRTTRTSLSQAVVDEAFTRLTFTVQPGEAALAQSALKAAELGLLPVKPAGLDSALSGLLDLTLLNQLQAEKTRRK